MQSIRTLSALLLLSAAAADVGAQSYQDRRREDDRDTVTLRDGRTLEGRVVSRHGAELTLDQSGKLERLPIAEVGELDLVTDRLRVFLDRRRPGSDVAEAWALVGLARSYRLDEMARLQALHVLTLDPEHEAAHELLGHRRRGSKWRWELDGDSLTKEDFDEEITESRARWELRSEHWVLLSDVGLRRALDCLFDLERAYVDWHAEFGTALEPNEVLDFMFFEVYADADDMPKESSSAVPYYDPGLLLNASSAVWNIAYTYYVEGAQRAEQLLQLATQQLIVTTLLEDASRGSYGANLWYRDAAWAEVGLGHWFGTRYGGPAGYAKLGPHVVDPELAQRALQRARKGPLSKVRDEVTNLVGLTYGRFHELTDERELYWAKVATFMAFMLEPDRRVEHRGEQGNTTREAVMSYLRTVYGTPAGHSSSTLDEALGGFEVEVLQDPWREWLESF